MLLNQLSWFSPRGVRARAGPGDRRAAHLRGEGALRTDAGRPLDVRRSAPPVTRCRARRHVRTAEHRRTSSTAAGAPPSRSSGSRSASTSSPFLLVLTTLIVLALFFFAFRKPKVMPGKFQLLMELGVQFVRDNIAEPMLGPDADDVHAAPRLVLLLHPDREHVRGRAGHQLLGEQSRGDPARAGPGLVVHVQHRRDPTARLLRLPPAHDDHPGGAGDPAVRAVDADRIHLEHHRAADHPHRPSHGQLRGRALPAGDLLPGDRLLPRGRPEDLAVRRACRSRSR